MDLLRIQLDRANAIMASSTKYQIPADLAASIYDIALSEGIDPALGFQLVKIESNFKANARSTMGAIGYTQLQVATARFYEPGVTERALMTDRELNLRVGFRFLNDLLGQVRSRHPSGAAGLQPRAGQGGRHPGAGRRPDQRLFRRRARGLPGAELIDGLALASRGLERDAARCRKRGISRAVHRPSRQVPRALSPESERDPRFGPRSRRDVGSSRAWTETP